MTKKDLYLEDPELFKISWKGIKYLYFWRFIFKFNIWFLNKISRWPIELFGNIPQYFGKPWIAEKSPGKHRYITTYNTYLRFKDICIKEEKYQGENPMICKYNLWGEIISKEYLPRNVDCEYINKCEVYENQEIQDTD